MPTHRVLQMRLVPIHATHRPRDGRDAVDGDAVLADLRDRPLARACHGGFFGEACAMRRELVKFSALGSSHLLSGRVVSWGAMWTSSHCLQSPRRCSRSSFDWAGKEGSRFFSSAKALPVMSSVLSMSSGVSAALKNML